MGMKNFLLKGNICYSLSVGELKVCENSYVVCLDGRSGGVFQRIPAEYEELPVIDYGEALILPGMIDIHIHAPQFAFRGMGMDDELLNWLQKQTFPEEAKYADAEYARKAYGEFAAQMKQGATSRAVIFGTVHKEATLLLMEAMEQTGLVSYVGKVNMDQNAPEELLEKGAETAAADTEAWLRMVRERDFRRTMPILTPRFIPGCSESLLKELGKIREKYGLPVQSHLSENPEEVALVKTLMPDLRFYGEGYDRYGLFGGKARTVMAHCIYSTEEEIQRLRENGVWVAHCPGSNMNLASGIAPIRRYLELGIRTGLGSDVAGGHTESIFRAITDAIQVSKLYWRYLDHASEPLTFAESFYLATKGGGSFFGRVGSFEKGYELDAVVIDDSVLTGTKMFHLKDRLERAVYLGLDRDRLIGKYVKGRKVV